MPAKTGRWFALALICCLPCAAAEEPAQGSPYRTFLEAITVSATRGSRPLAEAPGTVSVIDADRIEELAMRDLRDLVRYEPGVYVSSSGAGLGLGGFNIRGIGGNRVLTRIDGVPTTEEFEFGHFEVNPFALDLDLVERVEILRGAASSLYGSDALGGVVSFETKDPSDYLDGRGGAYQGLRAGWDGRSSGRSLGVTAAAGGDRWRGSIHASLSRGSERDNQGEIAAEDASRTAPDPQDWRGQGLLAKATLQASSRSRFELALETYDRETDTRLLSTQTTTDLGRILGFPAGVTYRVDKSAATALDEQRRRRLSLEHDLTAGLADHLLWRVHLQQGTTEQRSSELRSTTLGGGRFGPESTAEIVRRGLLRFEQESSGVEIELREDLGSRHLLTFGLSLGSDRFEQLRDRVETDRVSGEAVESADGLEYPTRYFPASRVVEAGIFGQAELDLAGGRFTLIPGLRLDRYALGVDENDAIFLSGNRGTEPPVELEESSLSPKLGLIARLGRGLTLHAQYARGFRAPPFSAVNSGFTHLAGGLTRLPNPELAPETSDGYEIGLRGSYRRGGVSLTFFNNLYDDFIELQALGFNPVTGLIEFQHRNVARARIRGLEAAGDAALGRRWTLRAGLAWSEGEDRGRSLPLNSIHPAQMVAGLRRSAERWSVEAAARVVGAKEPSDLDRSSVEQFAAPGFTVLDLFGSREINRRWKVNAGVVNLLDETYWEWPDALGQTEESAVLDRYTGPGRGVVATLRFTR